MSDSQYISYDKSSMNGDDAMITATDQFVTDMNKLYEIADEIGLSQDFTDDLITQMTKEQSDASSNPSSSSMDAMLTGFGVLLSDSNTVIGAVVFMMQVTSVIADCKNMTTIGMNGYSSVMSQSTSQTDDNYFTSVNGQPSQAYDDTQTFNDSIEVFTTTTFTVHNADGTTEGTATGILGLVTDESLCPADRALMDTQSADLIETSFEGIEGLFGSDWGNINEETADIKGWSVPETNSDGSEEITSQQNNTIINDFASVNAQWDSQTTTDQTAAQQLANLAQQYYDAADDTETALTSMNAYINQQTGSG